MKTSHRSFWSVLLGLALLSAFSGRAEDESYETLTIGTNVLKNVRIIQSSPVDLLLGHDTGYKRVKLQDLPADLQKKYPYDVKKAAEYKKEKEQEASARHAQNVESLRAAQKAKAAQLRSHIDTMEKELRRLSKDIETQDAKRKGKGAHSNARRIADQMRTKKMVLRDKIWKARDELERLENP